MVASQRPLSSWGQTHRVDETQMQEKGIDKRFATGYDERAGGVDAIGNVNNEVDIPGHGV